jgi:hypothetical protein
MPQILKKGKELMKMNVKIIQEWYKPDRENTRFRREDKNNPFFYIVLLQKGRQRYLKIGTTEKGIGTRFSAKDYKEYSHIRFLWVAEVACDKAHNSDACYHVEDLTRSAIREMKGFTFVKNDRFQFFQLPKELPVYLTLNNHFMLSL